MTDRVVVLGTGLIGTSVALALCRQGIDVGLADSDPVALATAVRLSAGSPLRPADPPADVVVVAVPPAAVAGLLLDAQRCDLGAAYTDVASAKVQIIADAQRLGCDLSSFVPGHPMAGRELSGPGAASAELFVGRPWALCPSATTSPQALAAVTAVVTACGGRPRTIDPVRHDHVVAAVSHAPHLISSAVAARFAHADRTTLSLAGRGLADVTRIAAGDTTLWTDILRQNGDPVATALESVARDLMAAAASLRAAGSADVVTALLTQGKRGRDNIADATR